MKEIDVFASELFEEAKRFLEKAKDSETDEGKNAFLHASLLLGVSSLEAHINAISDELSERPGLSILDQSVLREKEYAFDKGEFTLTKRLKIYNLIERIEFIVRRFTISGKRIDTSADWWSKLHRGIDLRNSLVHPKDKHFITHQNVEAAFEGIIEALDAVYMNIYDRHFPALGRRFDSKLNF